MGRADFNVFLMISVHTMNCFITLGNNEAKDANLIYVSIIENMCF